jgi:hypothetical protein
VVLIPVPEIPRQETIIRSVPENHVLLIFGDDSHAEGFNEWVQDHWSEFQKWAQENGYG